MVDVDYRVVSADSHVIEPHDLWQRLIDPGFRHRAPVLVHDEDTDRLQCDEAQLPPVGLLAGCARSDEEVRWEGRWDEDVFPGGFDPDIRLEDLRRDGVDAEVLYPTIAMQLYPVADHDFQWALFRAYNTWLGEEFCAAHPERYKGVAMLDHVDVDAAVNELKRCRDLGLAGVMVPLYPGEDNPYHDPRFDPLWAAAVDHGMPVSLHAATTRDRAKAWNTGTPTDAIVRTVEIQRVLLDMILSGLFDRVPGLQVVSAENDAGWAGSMLERADYFWHRNARVAHHRDTGGLCRRPPSEYFRESVHLTFMRDHTAVLASSVIGQQTLLWGNDFPHHVSTWPRSQQVLGEHFDKQPAGLRQAVVCDNARALYGF